jgi:heptosyltransferase-1
MRVLIIKLTSMGDLMHAFPALTDAVKHIPGISFDWVVDESFAEVPQWHPAVKRVITTAHRRWKKSIVHTYKNGEFGQFREALNRDDYDVVVDLQSNLKSAFVSWLRRGPIHGYDKNTCREKPAHWSYATQYTIPLRQHAIERQRQLFAKIFGYEYMSTSPQYGVDLSACSLPDDMLPEKYVVFVHNASWPTKLWPIDYWQALMKKVSATGYSVLLPCGSSAEYERAQHIASGCPNAVALPKMSLNHMAGILSHAQAAVCSDTGLAHMAAVTSTPAITLYAVTDTVLIGTVGHQQQHIVAGDGDTQSSMHDISVASVWKKLSSLL